MKDLTILASVRRPPNLNSVDIMAIKNIIPELKKFYNVKIIWLTVLPLNEKIKPYNSKNDIIYFQNYQHISEIFNEVKPDLVFVRPTLEPINFSILIESKHQNIPSVNLLFRTQKLSSYQNKLDTFSSNMRMGLSSQVKGDLIDNESGKLKSFTFFLKRFFFLLNSVKKTQSNMSALKFIPDYFFKFLFSSDKIDHRFLANLNFCKSTDDYDFLIKNGFDALKIKIVGNPAFDSLFIETKKISPHSNKKQILLCTSSMHEHGIWSKKREFIFLKNVIGMILDNSTFSIDIKIHPTSSLIDEYDKELKEFLPNLKIYQEEDLLELVDAYDLFLIYGNTSAVLYPLLAGKPIISLNFFKESGDLITEKEIVNFECNSHENLIGLINSCWDKQPSKMAVEKYLDKYLGIFDGKSSERCAVEILNLLKNLE